MESFIIYLKKKFPCLLLSLFVLVSPSLCFAKTMLRVGYTDNNPVVFTGKKGNAKGVYVDVLDHIAHQEGWTVQYISATWEENLLKLSSGEIDLLLDIAYSAERAKGMSYSKLALVEDWARIFVNSDLLVTDFTDLSGKCIGLVRDDIHTDVFLQINKFLGVKPIIVMTGSYSESMDLFAKGQLEAMVLPNLQEKKLVGKVDYVKSDILFNPVELRFAAPLGTHAEILDRLDYHIARFKDKPSSVYYKSMTKWVEGVQRMVLPKWLSPRWVTGVVVGIIILVVSFNVLLRKQVQLKGLALEKSIAVQQKQESELNVAKDIQLGLLPENSYVSGDYVLSAYLEPARMVGGDFFDFFKLSDQRLCFLIADVADKGVPAALFMAATKTCLSVMAKGFTSVEALMASVNNEISENNSRCMFVTMFCAVLDLKTGMLSYTLAGHDPPYLLRQNGDLVALTEAHCMALGLDEDAEYEQTTVSLLPGDTLFMFTDGVSEAMNAEGLQFGEEAIKNVLRNSQGGSCDEVVTTMKDSLQQFVGDTPPHDDITMLCLRRSG